jgi:hypothetical protein
MAMRGAALVGLALMLGGCTKSVYEDTTPGHLEGKLIVQWLEPDRFLFIPDAEKPLRFARATGQVITPGRMLTDGGSIPRPMWVLRNYSPWGYAPAFIVHDWLFHAHHCQLPGHEDYDHHVAATVMAEVMKTLMEEDKAPKNEATLAAMYAAVSSSIAENLWNTGPCEPPPPDVATTPIRVFEIEFP